MWRSSLAAVSLTRNCAYSIYRHWRVLQTPLPDHLSGAVYLLLCRFFEAAGEVVCPQRYPCGMCPDWQRFWIYQPFFKKQTGYPDSFWKTAVELGIQHKLIRPYMPRHNGKVERSHREDQKRFYSLHSFFSLADFQKQIAVHNRRSNNLPMRPLQWLAPLELLVQFVWQTYKETFLNLTDRFLIFAKLRECRCHLSDTLYQAMQKENSRHHLSRRAGSSFFTYLYNIGQPPLISQPNLLLLIL